MRKFCSTCDDTGFRPFRCDGNTGNRGLRDAQLTMVRCTHRQTHYAHSYVERCECVEQNPVILQQREWAAARAARKDA